MISSLQAQPWYIYNDHICIMGTPICYRLLIIYGILIFWLYVLDWLPIELPWSNTYTPAGCELEFLGEVDSYTYVTRVLHNYPLVFHATPHGSSMSFRLDDGPTSSFSLKSGGCSWFLFQITIDAAAQSIRISFKYDNNVWVEKVGGLHPGKVVRPRKPSYLLTITNIEVVSMCSTGK